MDRQSNTSFKPAATLLIAGSLLGGCATNINQPDIDATSSARISATPNAAPQRTITNFTQSLRCMDDLLERYEISGLLIGAQEVADLDSEVAGTKDMLMTALSTMTRKSRAFGVVTLSQDLGDVTAFHSYHSTKDFQSPDFFIRLSTPQIDKGVQVDQLGAGIQVDNAFGAEHSRDRMASVISLDMNMGLVRNLQLLSGVYSSNSIAVVRKGQANDLSGEIRKLGALIRVSSDNSEGFHHSVRTLIELGAIELVGRLTQTPYWECLDISATNPAVQAQVQDWYESLNRGELITFLQAKLRAKGLYDGPVDGKDNVALRTSLARYKADVGQVADGNSDFAAYFQLVNDPTPIETQHLELLTLTRDKRRRLPGLMAGSAASQPVYVSAETGGIDSPQADELELAMRTGRGVDPAVYRSGEEITVSLSTSADAHVYCYYQQGNGTVMKVFPNRFRPESRVRKGEVLLLPGEDGFKIIADARGTRENLMCMASYVDIDKDLPFELSTRDLQPLPVADLEQVYGYYKSVADTLPLRQTISVEVF